MKNANQVFAGLNPKGHKVTFILEKMSTLTLKTGHLKNINGSLTLV